MHSWKWATAKELGTHALIGGAVATGLAGFHLSIEKWVKEGPSWEWLIPSLTAGVLVTAVIFFLEFLLKGTRIELERVGKIDGYWIDAIYDAEKRLTRGAVITIRSAKATGFFIDGTSFEYARTNTTKLNEVGTFKGNGSAWTDNSMTYYFTGHEGPTKIDEGPCHYIFSERAAAPGKLRFAGFFYSTLHKSVSYVRGRKVMKTEMEEFRRDEGETLLTKYLDGCAPIMPD